MKHAELLAVLRATGCAEETGGFVFLHDPKWSEAERAHVKSLTSRLPPSTSHLPPPSSHLEMGWLCVPTGGTTGGVRFARHDEQTLSAAVAGCCAHFGIARVNAVDVLPAHHVSGLMARVRCAATGGDHIAWDWKRLEAGECPALRSSGDGWVISLVPTQLQRLLGSPETVEWLRGFRVIFIGGGPIWPGLANAAAHEGLPVSLSYGMTETAAMIAALKPAEFLTGARSCGEALPHARIAVNAEGVVTVRGDSVFRGYFPHPTERREFVTEDLGRIDELGHLHILGRRDAVIITGGKKVHPAAVEAALRETGEFADIAVLGLPDTEWGSVVVACYPAADCAPDIERAVEKIPGHQRPKQFVPIADWPRNAQGKVNRAALRDYLLTR